MFTFTEVEFEKCFKTFTEEDEEAFGIYEGDSRISKNVFMFSICGNWYMARIIVNGFKVILESICQDVIASHEWLNENETLVADCLTKEHAMELAMELANLEMHLVCTGDELLMYGFKKL